MFCPNCGKENNGENVFCISCGFDLRSEQPQNSSATPNNEQPQNFYNPQNNQNQYSVSGEPLNQIVYDNPASNQNAFNQPNINNNAPFQNNQGFGSMPTDTGMNYAYNAPVPNVVQPQKKKSFFTPKKVIISVICLLLVVGIGFGAYFLIRNKMERDYIVNNPTKSAINSYKSYLETTEDTNEFFNVIKNMKDSGSVNISVEGSSGYVGQSQDLNLSAVYSYDKSNSKYYLRVDGGTLLASTFLGSSSLDSSSNGNTYIELCADNQKTYLNYDVSGHTGSYYLESENFREKINNSIFSPSNDNVLGLTEDQFNNFIDSYEKIYKSLSDSTQTDTDINTAYDSILNKIEVNGNATVEDGTAIVNGKEISADVITYTYDYNSFRNLLSDLKTETIQYVKKYNPTGAEQAVENLNQSFDNFIQSYENGAGENFSLVIKNYLDKSSHEIVKLEISANNFSKNSDDSVIITGEFSKEPNPTISFDIAYQNGTNEQHGGIKLSKTDDGGKLNYAVEISKTQDGQTEAVTLFSLSYDRNSKNFTLTYTDPSSKQEQSYSGKAEVSNGSIKITLDNIVDTESIKLNLIIVASSNPVDKEFKADKNILEMTTEEFQALAGSSSSSPLGSTITSANSASTAADAATINSACKTFYAGVASGTITSDDDPTLPSKGASATQRKQAAIYATVGQALDYSGIDNLTDQLYLFGYDNTGNIYSKEDSSYASAVENSYLSEYTMLGDLYGQFSSY